MNARSPLFLASLCVLLISCDSAPEAGPTHDVVREMLGDTTVVRTVSGSVWAAEARLTPEISIGELDGDLEYLFGDIKSLAITADGTIYVVDAQVPELRSYGPDGVFKGIIGRPGEGPGEIKRPNGGLAVLADGRVLVRDPGNARIQVYAASGEPLDTWAIRGGFNTSTPFHQTAADKVHAIILLDPEADVSDWQVGWVRMSPGGEAGDTLQPPDAGCEAPTLEARNEEGDNCSVSINGVPFSPGEAWGIHVDWYFVHGVSIAYRIDLLKPGTPLRIERVYEPIQVMRGEKAEAEARSIRVQHFDPGVDERRRTFREERGASTW